MDKPKYENQNYSQSRQKNYSTITNRNQLRNKHSNLIKNVIYFSLVLCEDNDKQLLLTNHFTMVWFNCDMLKKPDSYTTYNSKSCIVSTYYSTHVGEGEAESGGAVKRGISLESLCSHKQSKSSPSWIPLTLVYCNANLVLNVLLDSFV